MSMFGRSHALHCSMCAFQLQHFNLPLWYLLSSTGVCLSHFSRKLETLICHINLIGTTNQFKKSVFWSSFTLTPLVEFLCWIPLLLRSFVEVLCWGPANIAIIITIPMFLQICAVGKIPVQDVVYLKCLLHPKCCSSDYAVIFKGKFKLHNSPRFLTWLGKVRLSTLQPVVGQSKTRANPLISLTRYLFLCAKECPVVGNSEPLVLRVTWLLQLWNLQFDWLPADLFSGWNPKCQVKEFSFV